MMRLPKRVQPLQRVSKSQNNAKQTICYNVHPICTINISGNQNGQMLQNSKFKVSEKKEKSPIIFHYKLSIMGGKSSYVAL
jgi:hypothetical protein